MAVSAVEFLILGGERLVNQGVLAVLALEALLVPMLVLVGQILEVEQDRYVIKCVLMAAPVIYIEY